MNTSIIIQNDVIPVQADDAHEYLVETSLVAQGYGVSEQTIRRHKVRNEAELVEGKHWISISSGGTKSTSRNLVTTRTLWTKRGVVRLGFFIKSGRAKLFRDLAEDLVIRADESRAMTYPEALRRLADAVERGDKGSEAVTLIAPRARFGSPSPRTGAPRTRLIPAHFRSGLDADSATRRFCQLQSEFIDILLEN